MAMFILANIITPGGKIEFEEINWRKPKKGEKSSLSN